MLHGSRPARKGAHDRHPWAVARLKVPRSPPHQRTASPHWEDGDAHVAAVLNSAACLVRWIPPRISLQSGLLSTDQRRDHSKLQQRLECGVRITVEPALLSLDVSANIAGHNSSPYLGFLPICRHTDGQQSSSLAMGQLFGYIDATWRQSAGQGVRRHRLPGAANLVRSPREGLQPTRPRRAKPTR